MKAFCLPDAEGNPVLMEVPIPQLGANDVLVAIRTIGVGLHDRYTRPVSVAYPYPIGVEAAGTIQDVGIAVMGHKPGDRVMITGMHPKGGTWAEYAAVSEDTLIPMPEGLSFEDAAALPVAGSTALEGIKALHLKEGGSLFVAGASGAIGTLAIQLAVKRGCRVAASASSANHDYLRSLGATLAVDYRDSNWVSHIRAWSPGGVDAALAIQRGTGQASIPVVRDGGRVVTISGDQVQSERSISIEQALHHPETRLELFHLALDVAAGSLRVVIEQVYPFGDAGAALARTETGHARGKIILRLGDDRT